MSKHLETAQRAMAAGELPHLKSTPTLQPLFEPINRKVISLTYGDFLEGGKSVTLEDLRIVEDDVKDDDVVNVQFTSGTTGSPKAALLTHRYVFSGILHSCLTCAKKHRQQWPVCRY
jgi:acyl-CoA synthetase (AMP-forming)/AMP-acid ligase II